MSKRILWGTQSEHHFAYAASDMATGEVILYLEGIPTEIATRFSIQIGMSTQLAPTDAGPDECPWIYTNHSCSPKATNPSVGISSSMVTRDADCDRAPQTIFWMKTIPSQLRPFHDAGSDRSHHQNARVRLEPPFHTLSSSRSTISSPNGDHHPAQW